MHGALLVENSSYLVNEMKLETGYEYFPTVVHSTFRTDNNASQWDIFGVIDSEKEGPFRGEEIKDCSRKSSQQKAVETT